MGAVIFQGEKPFELIAQTHPTTTAEGRTVVVTLPVFVPGFPEQTVDVRFLLSIQQAEYLASQIQPVLRTARVNERMGR